MLALHMLLCYGLLTLDYKKSVVYTSPRWYSAKIIRNVLIADVLRCRQQ